MAKGTVKCTCKVCGKQFERSMIFRNRADADRWEANASYDLCADCYAQKKRKEEAEKASKYDLPQIEAVSDRQRDYAESLRARYIARFPQNIKSAQDAISRMRMDMVAKIMESEHRTKDEIFRLALDECGLLEPYICLTSADARDIIDHLRLAP